MSTCGGGGGKGVITRPYTIHQLTHREEGLKQEVNSYIVCKLVLLRVIPPCEVRRHDPKQAVKHSSKGCRHHHPDGWSKSVTYLSLNHIHST